MDGEIRCLVSAEAVPLPEILDPSKLQDLLAGQDYHMLETEIEAIVLKAKTEARLRERQRIREITEQVRVEAQRKLKYHVSVAQKQIREELNKRVTDEVRPRQERLKPPRLTPIARFRS